MPTQSDTDHKAIMPEHYFQPKLGLIYGLVILLTVIAFVALNTYLINKNLQQAEIKFNKQANLVYQHVHSVFNANDSILEGFAAFLSGVGTNNLTAIQRYSNKLLRRYPFIYQLQAAKNVTSNQLDEFNKNAASHIQSGYKVKRLDPKQGISPVSPETASQFYPLIFIAPKQREQTDIMGLDLLSLDFIQRAMLIAQRELKTTITEPFETFEGESAFILLQPAWFKATIQPDLFALLVIRTQALLPPQNELFSPLGIKLILNNAVDNRVFIAKPQPELKAPFYYDWLSDFVFTRELRIGSQTLTLQLNYHPNYEVVNISIIVGVFIFTLVLIAIFWSMYLLHQQSAHAQARQSELLYQMANFDSLTHLANRRHFHDVVSHSLAAAQRRHSRLVLLYLDLNKFKPINDNLGHKAGDIILIKTAKILMAEIREGDIAARVGGDEFVVLLDNMQDQSEIDAVCQRIKMRVNQIREIDYQPVEVGISIGQATYPSNGLTTEQLLAYADKQMYINKQDSSNVVPIVKH